MLNSDYVVSLTLVTLVIVLYQFGLKRLIPLLFSVIDGSKWELTDLSRFKVGLDLDVTQYPAEARVYKSENGPRATKHMTFWLQIRIGFRRRLFKWTLNVIIISSIGNKISTFCRSMGIWQSLLRMIWFIMDTFKDINVNIYIPISVSQLEFGLGFPSILLLRTYCVV